jgi:hypothetical protein
VAAGGGAAEPLGESLLGFLFDFRAGLDEPPPDEPGRSTAWDGPGRFNVGPQEPEPWVDDPYAGSTRQVTPHWWLAADGRWYPPELHPDAEAPAAEAS